MRKIVRLCLLITLLLCAREPVAQEMPIEPTHLASVEIGMPRERVLAGLSKRYKLARVDFDGADVEMYIVSEGAPQERVIGEVVFQAGFVTQVATRQGDPSSGDAVRFMRNFVSALRPETHLVEDIGGGLQSRSATASVTLKELRAPDLEEETLLITFDRNTVRVRISRSRRFGESVTVDRIRH